MSIQPVQATAQTANASQTIDDRTNLASDYEMFLQMLTTQLEFQDPLNPVDSSEYAVQLATFSSVEQQVLTNELLVELTQKMTSTGLNDLGSWIGRDVKSTAAANYEGQPITVGIDAPLSADRATFQVRDSNGTIVHSSPLDLDQDTLDWAGIDSDGNMVPYGRYSFSIEAFSGEEELGEFALASYAKVVEARTAPAGTVLVLDSGTTTPADEVLGVRG